jgi:hypothetical protein
MRISVIARAGIVAAVVALPGDTVFAQPKGAQAGDVMTVGTWGKGTAQDLAIPLLGILRAECSATGVASITLNGAPFDVNYRPDDGGAGGTFGLTTYSSSGPNSYGQDGAEVWVSNVHGQWRLEYYGFTPGIFGAIHPCRVGAQVTRIT